jgi:hypothetical protein
MLVSGHIMLWSGSIASIPSGWHLCDGTDGTPDLRDRFLQGAGGALNPDDVGGAATHDHNFTSDGHSHTLPAGATIAAGALVADTTTTNTDTGTTDAASSLPPYYALAYIMFL